MTVTAGRVVIGDDHVGTQQANLKHHAAQELFLTPRTKRLFGGLRKTKIAETEEVRLGALDFRGSHGFSRANDAELFVEFGTDSVLTRSEERRVGKERRS